MRFSAPVRLGRAPSLGKDYYLNSLTATPGLEATPAQLFAAYGSIY